MVLQFDLLARPGEILDLLVEAVILPRLATGSTYHHHVVMFAPSGGVIPLGSGERSRLTKPGRLHCCGLVLLPRPPDGIAASGARRSSAANAAAVWACDILGVLEAQAGGHKSHGVALRRLAAHIAPRRHSRVRPSTTQDPEGSPHSGPLARGQQRAPLPESRPTAHNGPPAGRRTDCESCRNLPEISRECLRALTRIT